jgi:aspartyl-tRNA(Asn)/glutamyl-tRNA(Gln) amidotransferase subunit B
MEVHVESKTQSKMFCSCKNDLGLETTPNINICPICTAQPGTLPVPNRDALVKLARFGQALNCSIADYTWFERKSYFYPDLPKGYQITQYERPLCYDGRLEIETSVQQKNIRITRIHMEEDTGKLSHDKQGTKTFVDYNRAGIPLMELVTEPDIRTAEEARIFCEQLQLMLRYLDISDANMEKGQMRCEVNISLRPVGTETFGTKVEIKNLNSFKAVENSITHEIKRQSELLEEGQPVIQETRGWDDVKFRTFAQRKKENAHDYRYFIEPDIPPFHTQHIQNEAASLVVELPLAKKRRFQEEYGLATQQATILIKDKHLARFYEESLSELLGWFKATHPAVFEVELDTHFQKLCKLATNYILTELLRIYTEKSIGFDESPVTPENYAEFISIVGSGEISSSAAQTVLAEMVETGGEPDEIISSKNLKQVSDVGSLQTVVDTVIAENQSVVETYLQGNSNSIQFLVGQVMKATKGSANPQITRELLEQALKGR